MQKDVGSGRGRYFSISFDREISPRDYFGQRFDLSLFGERQKHFLIHLPSFARCVRVCCACECGVWHVTRISVAWTK